MLWRNSEAPTDWTEAWGFRKINILFLRDLNIVGLKGDIQVTGGELCDITLQHSTVSLQQIWKRSSDLHRWSCNFRSWMLQKQSKCLSHHSLWQNIWFSFYTVLLPATFTVLSVDEKHSCLALHVMNFTCSHWPLETVTLLIIWVAFLSRVTVLLGKTVPSISQVTLASKTVRTKHVAFTSDAAIITVLKLGTSTWMEGGALEYTVSDKNKKKQKINKGPRTNTK